MGFFRLLRAGFAALLSLILACAPVHALVNIDDGRNQLFVSANLSVGYDSNLFANADGGSDMLYALDLGTQFVRRAGWIGLNANVGVNATRYGKYTGENFQNPHLNAEFTKQTGRTTGSLTLSAARQSRADTAANLRNESWNYTAGLNFKYPVIERYSFSGNLSYSLRDSVDNSFLVDLESYTLGLDLFYVFSTDRDLLAGYRIRRETTSANSEVTDHAFTVGMTGKLVPRLNGSVRLGYGYRVPKGGPEEDTFTSWTSAVSATWNLSKRINVTGQLSKDFSTTSTNISVDTLSTSLEGAYAINSKTMFTAGTGWGHSDFLGSAGDNRADDSWNWSFSLGRTFNDHLKFSLAYAYFRNWSTLAHSDFVRRSVTFSATARY